MTSTFLEVFRLIFLLVHHLPIPGTWSAHFGQTPSTLTVDVIYVHPLSLRNYVNFLWVVSPRSSYVISLLEWFRYKWCFQVCVGCFLSRAEHIGDNFTFSSSLIFHTPWCDTYTRTNALGNTKTKGNIYIKYLNENDFRVGKFISLQQKQFHYQTGDFLFAAF